MNIKIGTRKSLLALAQTHEIIRSLQECFPQVTVDIVEISTKGDQILDKPLLSFGGKGVFITEFEEKILSGEIDIAVHSGKDLPTHLAQGLSILATPKRADPRDVLISPKDRPFDPTRETIIGTGSLRRKTQLERKYPKATCVQLRGNVPTRLKKMESENLDGIILAAAGLQRLGITEKQGYRFQYLDTEDFLPAGAQGIIAVEGKPNTEIAAFLGNISHEETALAFAVERELLQLLEADCHQSVGAFCRKTGEFLEISAFLGTSEIHKKRATEENWKEIIKELAGALK